MGNCSSDTAQYRDDASFPGGTSALAGLTRAAGAGSPRCPHKGGILGLFALSDDGFVSCSDDGTMRRGSWPAAETEAWRCYSGHSRAVNRVVGDGRNSLYSVSRDLSIRQWDMATCTCTRATEKAHSLNISAVDVREDATAYVSGSRDYSVKVWDAETGANTSNFKRSRNVVTCLKFDPSGHLVYQGAEDLSVRVWDTRTAGVGADGCGASSSGGAGGGQPAATLSGYVYFPLSLDVDASGTYLATGCKGFDNLGADVKVWDLRRTSGGGGSGGGTNANATPHFSFEGHGMDASCAKFIGGGTTVLSAGKDGSLMASNCVLGSKRVMADMVPRNLMSMGVSAASKAGSGSGTGGTCFATVGYLDSGALARLAIDTGRVFDADVSDHEAVRVHDSYLWPLARPTLPC